jgi:hypothetical protein
MTPQSGFVQVALSESNMHAYFPIGRTIVIAADYGRMNESFTYAICSEGPFLECLCILRRMPCDLRVAQNYKITL